jgi:hypothetical protein
MMQYTEVAVKVYTFILAPDRQKWFLLVPATSPQVPHEHEARRTSNAAWMLWKKEKFLTLPEFEPQFLGHPAHSPAATVTDLSQLPSILFVTQYTAQPFMNSK